MLLAILAIFFITRILGGTPHAPAAAEPQVAEAAPSSVAAPDAAGAAPSAAAASAVPGASAAAESPLQPAAAIPPPAPADAAPSEPAVEVVDAGTMTQQSRRGFLLTLIQQGVLTGVQALDDPPKVGVTALFRGLSPSLQQQFIAVVYAYINNGAAGTKTLQLIDASSGAQIGSYSASDGLTLS